MEAHASDTVGLASAESATICFRAVSGEVQGPRPWGEVSAEALAAAAPWRTFRWHHGQRHYSGTYWSATEHGHVIYESRLELARLMFADFDIGVRHIVAQPFLLRACVDGVARRHIPDYLLVTGDGPVVVDVKPRARHRRRSWPTSGSWPATAGTGCSAPPCSMRCGRGTWKGSRWVRRAVACPRGRRRWCGRRCCTCCGGRSW